MYIRKSSESEERQALSIPAQERELLALAERRGYTVVGSPISEAKSAKRPGRAGFAELLERLERGEADGILCWHLDRLARNPLDGGQIMWALGQKTIRVIAAPDREYEGTPDDKMLMSIIFGMATKYSDDLAKNVIRGTREALQRGMWPGKGKYGYLRDPETNFMLPDPERWDAVRQLWQWRLDGVSAQEIHRRAVHELKLTRPQSRRRRSPLAAASVHENDAQIGGDWRSLPRPGGGPIARTSVYHLLSDPFYAGMMVYSGETYTGKHKPLVTMAEFEQVRALSGLKQPATPGLLPFAYRGLIKCGACGGQVTAERHTNRYGSKYAYYHCAHKRPGATYCSERSIPEAEIDRQVADVLCEMKLPAEFFDALLKEVEEQLGGWRAMRDQQAAMAEADLTAMDSKLERLRALLIDSVITAEDYATDRAKLVLARHALAQRIAAGPEPAAVLEPLRSAISCLNEAANRFSSISATKKHAVVRELCSNLTLKGKTLLIQAKEPLLLLSGINEDSPWWAVRDAVRTYLDVCTGRRNTSDLVARVVEPI
jgi:site-specific DNA recombinase